MSEETHDSSLDNEIEESLHLLESKVEKAKIQTLLSGKYDSYDAIMTLHSGAGGTEAQDWTEMLFRMYKIYAEKSDFKLKILDVINGDEAGLKSITFEIDGENAYGFLKAEKGVHRLVRISPFDANARRHTSFASVEVMPKLEEKPNIEIRPEDLKIDTYRSSGAGGQNVNKTESAIRITHLPTGIVVNCQDERSQLKNKERAMSILRSKLYDYYQGQIDDEYKQARKSQVGTGDRSERVRTYNYPQGRVTDHRVNLTSYNLTGVLNGDLDEFIDALTIKDRAEKLANM